MTHPSHSPFVGMLRGSLVLGSGALLGCAAIAAGIAGGDAARSALLGGSVALVVLLMGLGAIRLVMVGEPGPAMAGALVVYLGQVIALVAAMLVLREQPWLHGRAFALTAVVTTVAVQVGQISGFARARHELYPAQGRTS